MGIDGIQLKEEGDEVKEKKEDEVIHLRRTIGLLPAISFIIGTVVGSGIFGTYESKRSIIVMFESGSC